jgi:hypothetical protein
MAVERFEHTNCEAQWTKYCPFEESQYGEPTLNTSMRYSYTSDFKTFTTPETYVSLGDTTVIRRILILLADQMAVERFEHTNCEAQWTKYCPFESYTSDFKTFTTPETYVSLGDTTVIDMAFLEDENNPRMHMAPRSQSYSRSFLWL